MLFTNPILAILTITVVTTASPTALAPREVFSFSEWVEGIIADPQGDNLTPAEAVASWEASVNETQSFRTRSVLDKRAPQCATSTCRARVADAVWCIDRLARLGRAGTWCELTGYVQFCESGSAAITGHTGGGQYTASNCNDVARAGGLIMDSCTRPASNTVQGREYAWGNGNLLVTIFGRGC